MTMIAAFAMISCLLLTLSRQHVTLSWPVPALPERSQFTGCIYYNVVIFNVAVGEFLIFFKCYFQ